MKLIIVNNTKSRISAPKLQKLMNSIRRYFLKKRVRNKKLLSQKKELTIVFLSRSEMQKLNKQFRNKERPTDILSFASHDQDSLGELLLCTDVLIAQAKRHGHSFTDEITYMLIHGLLHLLGYDHEISKKEETLMFQLQDKCFKELV